MVLTCPALHRLWSPYSKLETSISQNYPLLLRDWQLGRSHINFLVLGVVYQDIVFSLLSTLLDKKGNSNTNEWIELFESFLEQVPARSIDCLVADRVFIWADWFCYLLTDPRYRFHVRLKANHEIERGSKQLRAM